MPVNLTQSQIASVSSAAVKALLRAENMGTFKSAYGDEWVDPLDPRIINMLSDFENDLEQYTYVSGKTITTVSFELYGTSSAWWIILYLNGIMHPDEIPDGKVLRVPSRSAMAVLLQTTAKNNRGQQVTI